MVPVLAGLVSVSSLSSETLEDRFGDGSSSGCTSEGTPIEQRILNRGSGGYTYPSSALTSAILSSIDKLLARDPTGAHAQALAVGYQVTALNDTTRLRTLHVLEPSGPGNPGHGYFVFDVNGNRNIILQAPHVGFDTRTVDFALRVHMELAPLALMIPGADRYTNHNCDGCSSPCNLMSGKDNSDVTRTELSLFHQVHQHLLDRLGAECRRPLVIQFHGFGSSTQSASGCGYDFILSDGDGTRVVDPPHLTRTGERLAEHTNNGSGDPDDSFTWNIASGSGGDCSNLLATLNQQGAATRAAGGLFSHLEMDRAVRAWPDINDASEIADALAETLLGALDLSVRHGTGDQIILEWQGGLGDEVLYRSSAASDFCNQADVLPAPGGSMTLTAGPGLTFYRVE